MSYRSGVFGPSRLQRFLSLLLSAAIALSPLLPARIVAAERSAPAATGTSATAAKLKIRDTALDKQGLLRGKVVDRQGQPLGQSPVVVRQGGQELARTKTNSNGDFAFQINRGGVLQLATVDDSVVCRVWSQQAAPPSAQAGILLCSGASRVRGQCQCGKPTPSVSVEELRGLAPDLPEGQFAAIMRADVVITNPDHYSVVIAYNPATGAAVVVAKGVDDLALQIQRAARAAGIPVVQNPPLARALYDRVAVGENVPADLLGQVTDIIGNLNPPVEPAFEPDFAPDMGGGEFGNFGLAGWTVIAIAVAVPAAVISHNNEDDAS